MNRPDALGRRPAALTFGSTMTAVAGLAVVLALVLAAARAARALGLAPALAARAPGGGAPDARRLALAETLALDPRRRLTLVRCDGRDVLVLTGGAQDVMLPLPDEAAARAAAGAIGDRT
jgi:flagellar protein FliO/FliZ